MTIEAVRLFFFCLQLYVRFVSKIDQKSYCLLRFVQIAALMNHIMIWIGFLLVEIFLALHFHVSTLALFCSPQKYETETKYSIEIGCFEFGFLISELSSNIEN